MTGTTWQASAAEPGRASGVSVQELRRTLDASLLRVGLPPLAEADQEDRLFPYLFPVGDLDGDGQHDVVALSRPGQPGQDSAGTTRVVARRGTDGGELWTREVRTEAVVYPVAAPSGPDGEPGVLLAGYALTAFGSTATSQGQPGESPFGFGDYGVGVTLDLVALTGTGQPAWSRSYAGGAFAYTGTTLSVVRGLPLLGGLLDAFGGPATDVLVSVYDRAPSGATTQDDALTTFVVDGADGSERGRVVADVSGARAEPRPAGDLDGDGRDDYLVAVSGANDEVPDLLTARRGSDGQALWTTPVGTLSPGTFTARPLGDTDGDGSGEVVLGDDALPQTPSQRQQAQVRVVDGASGRTLLAVPGQRADVVGDVDGDGVRDLAVQRLSGSGLLVRVLSARGEPLATRTVALPGTVSLDEQGPAGDVDGDGVQDLRFSLRNGAGTDARTLAGVLSGRTAAVLRSGPLPGRPLGLSVDGSGDDFVRVDRFGDSVRDISVVDGLTGTTLRTVRVRPQGDRTSFEQVAVLPGRELPSLLVATSAVVADGTVFPDSPYTSADDVVRNVHVLDLSTSAARWQTDPDGMPPSPTFRGTAAVGAPYGWSGTARTGVSPASGDGACATTDPQQRCERTLVELRAAPGQTRTLTVDVGAFAPLPGPISDLDLRVLDSDATGVLGPELGSSGRGALDEQYDEQVEVPLGLPTGSRFVLVEVVYFTTAETGYRGTVTLS